MSESHAAKAIAAIHALLSGEWDRPELLAVGPLYTECGENIRLILDYYSF